MKKPGGGSPRVAVLATKHFFDSSVCSARAELVLPAILEVRGSRSEETWKLSSGFCCRTCEVSVARKPKSLRPVVGVGFFEPLTSNLGPLRFSGGHTARVTPVPIPNTEVKPRWADDTARVTAWERRSLPGLN
jgi:hypothetical protein